MNDSLKKFINLADWAKKQTVEILDVIGKLIQFKSAGWLDHGGEQYVCLFNADIMKRMSCLLSTIMNLGLNTINIGPFKEVLMVFGCVNDYLEDHIIYNPEISNGTISRNELDVIYMDLSKRFATMRDNLDELVRDIKKETKTE